MDIGEQKRVIQVEPEPVSVPEHLPLTEPEPAPMTAPPAEPEPVPVPAHR